MSTKQILFSTLIAVFMANTTVAEKKERPANQIFELDLSSLENYEYSLHCIGLNDEHVTFWAKKTYTTRDFASAGDTAELKDMLNRNDLKKTLQIANRELLKIYVEAMYLTYDKPEKQKIACIYCDDIISRKPDTPSQAGIILDSTNPKDCERLKEENGRIRLQGNFD